jgi:cation transporter-like permease
MEDISNASSEQELLQLRNEGKISENEYEELRSAMRKSTKVEVEPSTPTKDKAKAKRKLGKTAFTLMLAGSILPALGYGFTVIIGGVQTEPTLLGVQEYRKLTNSTNTGNLRQHEQHEQRIEELKRATEAKRTTLVATLAAWFFLCVASEIGAFVLGVIAWPDVFAKATVVTISFITVLAFLFALLTVA